jgi:hypothetical protein
VVEQVNGVVGGQPGCHQSGFHLIDLQLDRRQLVQQRFAVALPVRDERRGFVQDRLVNAPRHGRQVGPA